MYDKVSALSIMFENSRDFPDRAGEPIREAALAYARTVVTDGLPLNTIARVMGHEQISTTLDRYTHAFASGADKVRDSFADFPLTFEAEEDQTEDDG